MTLRDNRVLVRYALRRARPDEVRGDIRDVREEVRELRDWFDRFAASQQQITNLLTTLVSRQDDGE